MNVLTIICGYFSFLSPNFGGGSGSSGQIYYDKMNDLYGQQARIAGGVYDKVYAPYAPGAVADLDEMRNQDLSGTARAQAGSDADNALGQGVDAVNRNTARYGLNANKFANDSNAVALGGAASKSAAMNQASQWANQQKWSRTSDFYNSLSGVPTSSANSMGQAAAGYGNAGNAARSANAQSSSGLGAGMAYMMKADGGYIDRKGYARGGEVHAADGQYIEPARKGLRQDLWLPSASSGNSAPSNSSGGGGGIDSNTALIGMMAAKKASETDLVKGWVQNARNALKYQEVAEPAMQAADYGPLDSTGSILATTADYGSLYDGANAVGSVVDAAANVANVANEADTVGAVSGWFKDGGEVHRASGGSIPRMGLRTAVTNQGTIPEMGKVANEPAPQGPTPKQIAMAAANTAPPDPDGFGTKGTNLTGPVATASLNYAFPFLGTVVNAVAPGAVDSVVRGLNRTGEDLGRAVTGGSDTGGAVGAMLLDPVGSIFSGKYFADGGQAQGLRRNLIAGGPVQGPGTETSDSIPAKLSDGEYVLNAAAVKIIGKKKLDALNKRGLALRNAGVPAKNVKQASSTVLTRKKG